MRFTLYDRLRQVYEGEIARRLMLDALQDLMSNTSRDLPWRLVALHHTSKATNAYLISHQSVWQKAAVSNPVHASGHQLANLTAFGQL